MERLTPSQHSPDLQEKWDRRKSEFVEALARVQSAGQTVEADERHVWHSLHDLYRCLREERGANDIPLGQLEHELSDLWRSIGRDDPASYLAAADGLYQSFLDSWNT